MNKTVFSFWVLSSLLMVGFDAAPAYAQSSRTWVSGSGSDSNPCTRSSPCATFAAAYAQTVIGGEIDVLDPGGFGVLTITHSISIYNDGVGEAGIMASGANGITISAGASDVINLRGLVIDGVKSGLYGVQLTSGGTLSVQNCLIQAFATGGIYISPTSGSTSVKIQDTTIIQNASGVEFKPSSGASVTAFIDHTRIDQNNGAGLRLDGTAGGPVTIVVADSSVSGNVSNGMNAVSGSGGNVTADLMRDIIASNAMAGIQANPHGGTAIVTVGDSMLSNNGTALAAVGGGSLRSFGNNQVTGSVGTGFSGPVGPQ
jgi:hypothetical protein